MTIDNVSFKRVGEPVERIYLAELMTDSDGDVSWFKNLPVAKQKFTEVEIHEDLTVHGEIKNTGVATAWVNFNGTQNPPLVLSSYNIDDVVDLGTGHYQLVNNNLDFDFRNAVVTFGAPSTSAAATSIRGFQEDTDIPRTKNTYTFYSVLVNATVNRSNFDPLEVNIAVFGGKS